MLVPKGKGIAESSLSGPKGIENEKESHGKDQTLENPFIHELSLPLNYSSFGLGLQPGD